VNVEIRDARTGEVTDTVTEPLGIRSITVDHGDLGTPRQPVATAPNGVADRLLFGDGWADSAQVRPDRAERELIAAEELCRHPGRSDERLIIRYELARLTAGSHQRLRDALLDQARQLWELRLQRLAMLRQAQQPEELESRRANAERQLMHDPLTGLANRRRFDQLLTALDEAYPQQPVVFLLIDVDKFKAINDTYSHDTGDEVLRAVAETIRAHCRQAGDVAVRYAGDEFAVFLYSTDLDVGIDVAERIRSTLHDTDFRVGRARAGGQRQYRRRRPRPGNDRPGTLPYSRPAPLPRQAAGPRPGGRPVTAPLGPVGHGKLRPAGRSRPDRARTRCG
jgi:diguanylate cyclase (GGDEF)-like protein